MEPHGHMTEGAFGEMVRAARMRRKWSQGELAGRVQQMGVDLSQGKVSLIEKGTQAANPEMRRALVDLLGLGTLPPKAALPPPEKAVAPAPEHVYPPAPEMENPALHARPAGAVADLPRTTLYLDHATKRLLDAASRITGRPVYKLLAEGFFEWLERRPAEEQQLIRALAERE